MNKAGFYITVFFASTFQAAISHQTDVLIKKNAASAPDRPTIANTFQVEVEAIFKDRQIGIDGTLYFDQPNNIAVADVIWQDDFGRKIYSFDTNELITIKGYDCEVKNIPDDPALSFFPFTFDSNSKRKIIAPPEKALYFDTSNYVHDVYDGAVESYMYQGYIDLPMYQRNSCSIIHYFSKSNFETAHCDSEYCKPILLTISVACAGMQENIDDEGEISGGTEIVGEVDHIYKFFHFEESIKDEAVFHPPPGIYCERKPSKSFPLLPIYFSFSFDIVKHEENTEGPSALKYLHKKVWYDGDLELIRVDGFDEEGFVRDTHVYDFYHETFYMAIPHLDKFSRGLLPQDTSLKAITTLPNEVFPRSTQEYNTSAVYAGVRKLHGMEYNVWSVMTKDAEAGMKVVTDLYFQRDVRDRDGDVEDVGLQLSFLEVYSYNDAELSEVTFVPINNFQSGPRDFTMFDLSPWFEADEKRDFEISITGPKLTVGTKTYAVFLEQLYLEIVTAASVSTTRIAKMEMLPSESASVSNTTVFRGMILGIPEDIGIFNSTGELDLDASFSQFEKTLSGGGLEFTITGTDGKELRYVLSSFKEVRNGNNIKKGDESKDGKKTYSGGVVAGAAFGMLFFGFFMGAFAVHQGTKGNIRRILHKRPVGRAEGYRVSFTK